MDKKQFGDYCLTVLSPEELTMVKKILEEDFDARQEKLKRFVFPVDTTEVDGIEILAAAQSAEQQAQGLMKEDKTGFNNYVESIYQALNFLERDHSYFEIPRLRGRLRLTVLEMTDKDTTNPALEAEVEQIQNPRRKTIDAYLTTYKDFFSAMRLFMDFYESVKGGSETIHPLIAYANHIMLDSLRAKVRSVFFQVYSHPKDLPIDRNELTAMACRVLEARLGYEHLAQEGVFMDDMAAGAFLCNYARLFLFVPNEINKGIGMYQAAQAIPKYQGIAADGIRELQEHDDPHISRWRPGKN